METGRPRTAQSGGGHRHLVPLPRRRVTAPGSPSARLVALIEGDLSGYRRETTDGWLVRFVPVGAGPVLEVASRTEKRFLGRTEIAVFRADLDLSLPVPCTVEVRHTGGLKRSGMTAVATEGGEPGRRLAAALASDRRLGQGLLPLDFTRFEVIGGPAGTRVEVELMGASHVAIALPPIRSYVHLYPDQRKAMTKGICEVRRVLIDSV